MKVIVSVVFVFLVFGNQAPAQDAANIEVIKFVWNIYVPVKAIDASAIQDDPRALRQPEQLNTGSLRRSERSAQAGEKTIEERSRDLARVENAARKSASPKPENIFVYELKIKNTDSKAIKSFIWEYRPAGGAESQNISTRQFLCVEKIKAGDSEMLRIFSHLPPANVVDASNSKNKSDKNYASDILINRVKYSDGTFWQRPGWDSSQIALDSPQLKEKLKNSNCAVL